MKKYLFLLLFLFIAIIFVSCEGDKSHDTTLSDATSAPVSKSVNIVTTSKEAETASPVSSWSPETTYYYIRETEAPYILWESVPDDMLVYSINCDSVYVPCKYNEGAYYDIPAKVDEKAKKITFILPCRVDKSRLTLAGIKDGEIYKYMTVDCSDSNNIPMVSIKKVKYSVEVMQSDSPSIFFNIDESYGTIADMRLRANKGKECFGDFIMTMTDEKAAFLGLENTYISKENDEERAGTALFRGRGNASWGTEKQTFLIKLEKKANLFGFGKGKSWIISPCYKDPTMLRYQMSLHAAYQIGAITPQYMLVDVFMNGTYTGSYLFFEKISIGEGRVDINDLEDQNVIRVDNPAYTTAKYQNPSAFSGKIEFTYYKGVTSPEDITGGYIVEKDSQARCEESGCCWFKTTRGLCFSVHSPEICNYDEMVYISTLFQQFEDSIYEKNGINRLTGKSYDEYMDMDSFISRYFIDEIFWNTDSYQTSCYFYKPADIQSELIYSGPLWDYDNTFDWGGSLPQADVWYLTNMEYLNKYDSGRADRYEYYKQCFTIKSFNERAVKFFEDTVYPAIAYLLEEGSTYDQIFEDNRDSIAMSMTITGPAKKDYDGKYAEYRKWLKTRINYFKNTIREYYGKYKR